MKHSRRIFEWTLHPTPVDIYRYGDSKWMDVQLPHDGLIASTASYAACPGGCSGKSFLPRHVLWYRKTFKIPTAWVS